VDYRIENNIIRITDAIGDLLTGEKKLAFEYPFDDQPDFTVRVIGKFDDLES
jgi:hypothetical protein